MTGTSSPPPGGAAPSATGGLSGKAITPAPGKLMASSVPMRSSDAGRRDAEPPPQSARTPTFVPVTEIRPAPPAKPPAQPDDAAPAPGGEDEA
jgi:hypothetical protein